MTRSRILVPIDFQRQSDLALEYAGHIAPKLKAMISCIYVMEEQGMLMNRVAGEQTKHKLRREAENALSKRVNAILKDQDNIPFEISHIINGLTMSPGICSKTMGFKGRKPLEPHGF